jgi:hypothetical protein
MSISSRDRSKVGSNSIALRDLDPLPPSGESLSPPAPEVDHSNRLSRPGPARITFYFTNALGIFWIIGFLRARRLAGHQFLAENAHRLPTNDAGWYLYHRAKNYRMVWRGFKGGCKYGLAGGASAFLYGLVEETWDQRFRRGKVDPGGSMVAGTVAAGAFATVKRMGKTQTWRCLRVGMGLGLVSGVLQDLLRWGRGAPPWYVESLRGRGQTLKQNQPAVRKV